MISALLNRLRPAARKAPPARERRYRSGEHLLRRKDISRGACSVVRQLQNAGYQAMVVGGCVRDLLFDNHPKDFDVATDATPEQVRKVFPRARIIGRRFRIVHVRQGPDLIEVTTYRGAPARAGDGPLRRDNAWGTLAEDSMRRDFTINSLYFDPISEQLLDFTNGLQDIRSRTLRNIGDPERRFREDPVRMLRAVRFAGKLGLQMEPGLDSALLRHSGLIEGASNARLFDEVPKLLLGGRALATWRLLQHYGLVARLFPHSHRLLCKGRRAAANNRLVARAMEESDRRVGKGLPVIPAFMYAVILWPVYQEQLARTDNGGDWMAAVREAADETLRIQHPHILIPRRFAQTIQEIWELQYRLQSRRRAAQLLAHPRFRAAFDFLVLRDEAGEAPSGLAAWWQQRQGDAPQDAAPAKRRGARGRRRRGRR